MPSKAAKEKAKSLPVDRYKSVELFDGQVTITMWRYYSGAVSYIAGGMKRGITDIPPANPVFALPSKEEYDAMGEAEKREWDAKYDTIDPLRTHFDTFISIIPYLADIEFNLNEEAPDELQQLQAWWVEDEAKALLNARRYADVWENYLGYEIAKLNAIFLAAWGLTRRDKMPASAELAVGAVTKALNSPSFLAPESTPSSDSGDT